MDRLIITQITMKCSQLPRALTIFKHSYYKIRPYVSPPLQCYNCQMLGHVSTDCKRRTRCLICSGNHSKDQCPKNEIKCASCRKSHVANSSECDYYRFGKRIENIRARDGKIFSEAKRQASNAQFLQSSSPRLYSQAHLQSTQTPGSKKEIATQTESSTSTQTDQIINDDFLDNLKKCLLSIFKSSAINKKENNLEEVISNSVINAFNKNTHNRKVRPRSSESIDSSDADIEINAANSSQRNLSISSQSIKTKNKINDNYDSSCGKQRAKKNKK